MKDIIFLKDGEVVKIYKIRNAFLEDGFRVLVDDYIYGKRNAYIVDNDGNSDRIFNTEQDAIEKIVNTAHKYMDIKRIDNYIIKEV